MRRGGWLRATGTLTEVWGRGQKKERNKPGALWQERHWGDGSYRDHDGAVSEGSYKEGMRSRPMGRALGRTGGVQEGPYEAGKRQGKWVLRFASGTVMEGSF